MISDGADAPLRVEMSGTEVPKGTSVPLFWDEGRRGIGVMRG